MSVCVRLCCIHILIDRNHWYKNADYTQTYFYEY